VRKLKLTKSLSEKYCDLVTFMTAIIDFSLVSKSYNYLEGKTMGDFGNNTKVMTKQFYIDAFVWGFFLWLIGYILSMILLFVVPQDMIGWVILPIGIVITLWVLLRKIKGDSFNYYLYLAIAWTLIAIVFDYLSIVKALNADGYYKLDVYLYYALTFILPLAAYWRKKST
jgi:hypothetical protein